MQFRHLVGLAAGDVESRAAHPFHQRRASARRRRLVAFALTTVVLPLAGCQGDPSGPAAVTAPRLEVTSGGTAGHDYRLVPLVDTRHDDFNSFGFGCSAINSSGAVAFRATRTSGATGIYVSSGGALITIVEDNFERFNFIGRNPSINDAGDVSFAASLRTGSRGEAILRGNGGPLTTIAQTQPSTAPGQFNFFGFDTSIDGLGNVAFKAELDRARNFDEGLFFGDGGPITTVYLASSSQFQGNDVGPASNEVGQIAFHEDLDSGESGIFRWDSGNFVTIADESGPLQSFFQPPSLNNLGVVAFQGFLDDGGSAILTGSGGPLTTVVDSHGPFSFFDEPSVNDAGLVAFGASLDSGEQGLYIGPDPVGDRIIRTGDRFHGGTVISVGFCREGLNNDGQLAFTVQLHDGRTILVLGTPKG